LLTTKDVEIQLETSAELTPSAVEGDTDQRPNPDPSKMTLCDPEVGEFLILKGRGMSNVNAKDTEPRGPKLVKTRE